MESLYLRAVTWADWQQGKTLSRLPDPLEFEDYPAPYDSFDWEHMTFQKRVAPGVYDVQTIWHPEPRILGFVKAFGFQGQPPAHCECGIEILSPEDYGQGYGAQALGLLLDYLRRAYPSLVEVMGLIHPANTRSLKLFQKLGFVNHGLVPDPEEPALIFEKVAYTLHSEKEID